MRETNPRLKVIATITAYIILMFIIGLICAPIIAILNIYIMFTITLFEWIAFYATYRVYKELKKNNNINTNTEPDYDASDSE